MASTGDFSAVAAVPRVDAAPSPPLILTAGGVGGVNFEPLLEFDDGDLPPSIFLPSAPSVSTALTDSPSALVAAVVGSGVSRASSASSAISNSAIFASMDSAEESESMDGRRGATGSMVVDGASPSERDRNMGTMGKVYE